MAALTSPVFPRKVVPHRKTAPNVASAEKETTLFFTDETDFVPCTIDSLNP
jgi:hypothetical protein